MEFHSFVAAAAAAAAATVAQRRRDSFFSSTEEGTEAKGGRARHEREFSGPTEFVVERITPQFIGQNLQCLVSPGEETLRMMQ